MPLHTRARACCGCLAAEGLADQDADALGDAHRRHEGQGVDRQHDIGGCQLDGADPADQQDEDGEGQDVDAELQRAGDAVSASGAGISPGRRPGC